MKQEIQDAIDEIKRQFADLTILVAEAADGGACVIIEDVPLGMPYAQAKSWVGFHITAACPYADTYPHFVRPDLSRGDNAAFGQAFSAGHTFPTAGVVKDASAMKSRPAIQVSRRSNHRDSAGLETPLLKLLKVLQWLRAR